MKKNKYTFVVDLTECIDDIDVFVAIAREKVNAGVPITKFEYNATVSNAVEKAVYSVTEVSTIVANAITEAFGSITPDTEKDEPKKKNIFARFWDWITRKK